MVRRGAVDFDLRSNTAEGGCATKNTAEGGLAAIVGYWTGAAGSKPSQPLIGVTFRCNDACRGWSHSSTRSSGAWWLVRI